MFVGARRIATIWVLASGILAVGCTPAATSSSGSFVERSGNHLTLDGRPWTFAGLNVYNLNSRGNCWYAMAGTDGLRRAVAESGAT